MSIEFFIGRSGLGTGSGNGKLGGHSLSNIGLRGYGHGPGLGLIYGNGHDYSHLYNNGTSPRLGQGHGSDHRYPYWNYNTSSYGTVLYYCTCSPYDTYEQCQRRQYDCYYN